MASNLVGVVRIYKRANAYLSVYSKSIPYKKSNFREKITWTPGLDDT